MVGNDGEFDNLPLLEYWVVAFLKSRGGRKCLYRQFLAEGYYEAFDKVMAFAERTPYHILWFKEKRNCGIEFRKKFLSDLEFVCTFCNKEFNDIEPIKCNFKTNEGMVCKSEFCSPKCNEEHSYFIHVRQAH